MRIPSLLISALKGGSGKTLVTVGLVAAIRKRGLVPSVFKKGPDYIDSGWLSLSAGRPCYNLDQHLFSEEAVLNSFIRRSLNSDISIIEGNRGLFDGVDNSGSSSSAELSKLLRSPTLMIIDCSKMTGTAAALVKGCQQFDPELQISGIILNRIKGTRHEHVVRQAIERITTIPVVGVIPGMKLRNFPQRHLGLLPIQEHPSAIDFVEEARAIVESGLDLVEIEKIALQGAITPNSHLLNLEPELLKTGSVNNIEIGILHDAAFQFYYPENLEELTLNGANIVEINSLESKPLPDIDALYIGGGFPETHAERLAENLIFRESIKSFVESGGPVYAECGGLMFLAKSLVIDTKVFPMAGVFSAKSVLNRKPQGLGYVELKARGSNPFFDGGVTLRGHEFHYSTMVLDYPNKESWAFDVLRGQGIDGAHDGLAFKNALGLYTHIHSLGEPAWAGSIVRKAKNFRVARKIKSDACPVEEDIK